MTILTPTGDRPEALANLCDYVARQSYRGPLQWVIVDDGATPHDPPTARPPADCPAWEVTYHRRHEPGVPGGSLNRNLIVGLRLAKHDKLVVLEDDDWYAPTYLETYDELLEHHPLVGESRARYYHVRERSWFLPGNTRWACLAQTGFRRALIPDVDAACRKGTPFIDLRIWERQIAGKHLIHNHGLHCGLKGGPGRRGLGQNGHVAGRRYRPDHNLAKLGEWIGEDAARYAGYAAGGATSDVSRSWFDWLVDRERNEADWAARPWLIVGKGPTFARRAEFDLSGYRTLGLNHVVRELPVDVAHVVDLECLEELGDAAFRAKYLVCPWHPHRGFEPQRETLADHCRRLPALRRMSEEGRLLHYHLLWAETFGSRPPREPVVGVKDFSVQAALNLIVGRGPRGAFTLGVDGGRKRSAEFRDPPGGGQKSGYDRQFAELSRIARVNRACVWPLTGEPLAGSDPEAIARLAPFHPARKSE